MGMTPIDHFMSGFRHAEKIHKVKQSVANEIEKFVYYDSDGIGITGREEDIQLYIDQLNKEQAENDLRWEQSEEDE